ncbi:ChuX/HutX family heme-like substrate-binding protein [Pseudomonas sp. CW003PS]|nr:ChuX/HutX family heme-like substrate-binding protein [Pseudomonas wenzhouensis]MDM9653071.1 ChuX/HutX family heme-like substrate-binding protein [Pseudomonas wenzhouensis]WGL64326.1 ChuX/HutX family heme-like substrate-binding protein [Pseudomonas sp. CW003PS]
MAVLRLRPDWAALLPALGGLGRVMVLTRNEHCVHELKGLYREVSVAASGQMGLVVSADIDLRLFLSGWASVFAVTEQTAKGTQRSIQVFDQQGVAVHKVYLTEHSELGAWQPLIERFAGEQWAQPLATSELTVLMEQAAAREVPIMVFVGNRHCIQIHTGPVNNLHWMDSWFNVLDPDFNLHLQTRGVVELWRVRKPSVDGVITSLEAFDADGELVIQLFGARKPGMAERDDWRELAESLPVLA